MSFQKSRSELLPKIPRPKRGSLAEAYVTALVIAGCVYWILLPIWPNLDTHILGDKQTDAIRGMWGMDNLRRSIIPPETPIVSTQTNFPAGALLLILPFVSGILLAPLGFLFGPIVGWNLSIAVLLWAFGMTSAWMVKKLTSSWAAGMVVGGLVCCQPMLLHP